MRTDAGAALLFVLFALVSVRFLIWDCAYR